MKKIIVLTMLLFSLGTADDLEKIPTALELSNEIDVWYEESLKDIMEMRAERQKMKAEAKNIKLCNTPISQITPKEISYIIYWGLCE